MTNKKNLILPIVSILVLTGTGYAFAGNEQFVRGFEENSDFSGKFIKREFTPEMGEITQMKGVKKIFINDESFDGEHVKFGGFKTSMKDGENTCFETMTDTEKQAFIRAKAEEQLVKMEAKEAVIDKLLLGVTLNSEEETLRQEIIQERADRKAQFEIRLKEAE